MIAGDDVGRDSHCQSTPSHRRVAREFEAARKTTTGPDRDPGTLAPASRFRQSTLQSRPTRSRPGLPMIDSIQAEAFQRLRTLLIRTQPTQIIDEAARVWPRSAAMPPRKSSRIATSSTGSPVTPTGRHPGRAGTRRPRGQVHGGERMARSSRWGRGHRAGRASRPGGPAKPVAGPSRRRQAAERPAAQMIGTDGLDRGRASRYRTPPSPPRSRADRSLAIESGGLEGVGMADAPQIVGPARGSNRRSRPPDGRRRMADRRRRAGAHQGRPRLDATGSRRTRARSRWRRQEEARQRERPGRTRPRRDVSMWIASSECPPRSKKSSVTPTAGLPAPPPRSRRDAPRSRRWGRRRRRLDSARPGSEVPGDRPCPRRQRQGVQGS